jgi:predicted Zn-ribbon and HTH transcriptional regulator
LFIYEKKEIKMAENVWYCDNRSCGKCDYVIVREDSLAPSHCPKCGAKMIKYEKRTVIVPAKVSWFGYGGRK